MKPTKIMKRVFCLLALLLCTSSESSADGFPCATWLAAPESARVVFAEGYRTGIFMATQIAPEALGTPLPSHETYVAIHKAIFPAENNGELVTKISLYCEVNPKKEVMNALSEFAAKEVVRKKFQK